jgi:rubrerythrin
MFIPHATPTNERAASRASDGGAINDLRYRNEAKCGHLLERSELLTVDDLDWTQVGTVELDSGVLDTLVYMRDVEGFTEAYAVGLGAHKTTLSDPLIREFLKVWQAEEVAHSRALGRFLDLYGDARGVRIPSSPATPSPTAAWYERALVHLGGPPGRVVAAAHMAWGAANELLTMNGYRLLARQCHDPVLADLLLRIAAQESRHYSFYLLQAEWRLASSALARAVLTRLLGRAWTPVGIGDGYKTTEDFRRVLDVIGAGPEGAKAIARMDRRFSALPGFDRLRIYRSAMLPTPA